MGKRMRRGDCGKRDEVRGLWGKGRGEGGDCGERDMGRGLWGQGRGEVDEEGTVGKGTKGGVEEGTV